MATSGGQIENLPEDGILIGNPSHPIRYHVQDGSYEFPLDPHEHDDIDLADEDCGGPLDGILSEAEFELQ